MKREEVKMMLPIMQAFADGKTIQQTDGDSWFDLKSPDFLSKAETYRIKPESKYRPFKNGKECLDEMLKHVPFGWIKCVDKTTPIICTNIAGINERVIIIDALTYFNFEKAFKLYTFSDGAKFGVKEEE